MKKVQSRLEATICLMNSPQGFNNSAAAGNFPGSVFINFNHDWTLESILTPYKLHTFAVKIIGIIGKLQNKKARFLFKIELLKWARKDLNLRPADYESAALTN